MDIMDYHTDVEAAREENVVLMDQIVKAIRYIAKAKKQNTSKVENN